MPAMPEFGCLPTAIGSMPHTNPDEACSIIMKHLPDIPFWPQLPKRSPKEKMIIQFSEGFPGVVIDGDKIQIEPSANFESELEQIYVDCEQDDARKYGISPEYAAGLYAFLSKAMGNKIVKGQVTGPITWGLAVTRQDGLGILYDDTLAEAAAKFLRLKASWQESILKEISPHPIIFVDEPYLSSFGSSFFALSRQKVVSLLEEVLGGIAGLKGVHCCGNTDWSLLLNVRIDILSYDAYNFAESLTLYPQEVKNFLSRGGAIAWGIVPTGEEDLAKESVASLKDRLEEAIAPFTRKGISFNKLKKQALLTPSCGLASLSSEASAEEALLKLTRLSEEMRKSGV